MSEDMSPEATWDPGEWEIYQTEVESVVAVLNSLLEKYQSETIRGHLGQALEDIASYTEWEEGDDNVAEAA